MPCRASPPQVGRSQVAKPSCLSTISPRWTLIVWGSQCAQPISPPVGEMPGRAEGGLRGGRCSIGGRSIERGQRPDP
ncbi:hypothetical protein ELH93_03650 [Rhizobium leguminosarum]|nr:hypothetical protein ELH93_03650 [Rhizobium leguminosarum]